MEQATLAISDYELERGKPMPSYLHAHVQGNLVFLLKLRYAARYNVLPELKLSLGAWDTVPDICLYPKREVDFNHDDTAIAEPPLLVVEILSASQTLDSLVDKVQKYFASGVKSCWIVIPRLRNIYVFSSPTTYEIYRDAETLTDSALGLELPLAQVFSPSYG